MHRFRSLRSFFFGIHCSAHHRGVVRVLAPCSEAVVLETIVVRLQVLRNHLSLLRTEHLQIVEADGLGHSEPANDFLDALFDDCAFECWDAKHEFEGVSQA